MTDHDDWNRRDVRRSAPRARGRKRAIGAILLLVGAGIAVGVAAKNYHPNADDPPPTSTVPPTVKLTFPEGLRREDMAALIDEKTNLSGAEFLTATAPNAKGAELAGKKAPTSLEGFLFPATYEIGIETTIPFLVDRQVQAFQRNLDEVDMGFAKSKNLTPYEVVILASMIEREVVVPAERRVVAGVMYNRLKRRMRLDIDATVQYAVGSWRPLTGDDLKSDSPYNTRKFAGLPPGPISNPGLASLQAAAHPRTSDFLYYVAREDGTDRHYFARTLDEFNQLLQKARQNAGG